MTAHPLHRVRHALIGAALALLAACVTATASAAGFPADSGIVNVRDHGARGDGNADDTQAIRAAISAARVDQGKVFWPSRIVYFPAGTYRITDTLAKRDEQGRYLASMALIGESAANTRLRLDDAAPGFTEPRSPKPMIFTASTLLGGQPGAGGKDYLGKGEGNDAYGNFVENLTLDVGRGNPGAVGIDFLASNSGAIRHVRLTGAEGSGRVGISMDRKWPGPLLLSDVQIDGFAIGISVSQREYGVTMEGVTLTRQSEVGLRNNGNVISMRKVTIETGSVALQNLAAEGLIVADRLSVRLTKREARFTDNRGYLTLKGGRVDSPDGRSVAADGSASVAAASDGAYFGALRLADYAPGWTLDVPPTPPTPAPAVARWANVVKFGARPDADEDSTEAIRAAMQSGAEAVYFPSGRYTISDTIDVPAKVRRIAGMFSSLNVARQRAAGLDGETGMFRVATGGEPLTIERIAFDNLGRGAQLGVDHTGERTVVLQDVIAAGTGLVHRAVGGGVLFLENTCCGPMVIAGPNGAWARQFNTEGAGVRIINDGAPLSILGLKTEQNATAVQNIGRATTDILGGLLYIVNPAAPDALRPAFINDPRARLSAAFAETVYREGASYRAYVSVPDASSGASPAVETMRAADQPARGRGHIVPGMVVGARR